MQYFVTCLFAERICCDQNSSNNAMALAVVKSTWIFSSLKRSVLFNSVREFKTKKMNVQSAGTLEHTNCTYAQR